jgi:hypothetical protein
MSDGLETLTVDGWDFGHIVDVRIEPETKMQLAPVPPLTEAEQRFLNVYNRALSNLDALPEKKRLQMKQPDVFMHMFRNYYTMYDLVRTDDPDFFDSQIDAPCLSDVVVSDTSLLSHFIVFQLLNLKNPHILIRNVIKKHVFPRGVSLNPERGNAHMLSPEEIQMIGDAETLFANVVYCRHAANSKPTYHRAQIELDFLIGCSQTTAVAMAQYRSLVEENKRIASEKFAAVVETCCK